MVIADTENKRFSEVQIYLSYITNYQPLGCKMFDEKCIGYFNLHGLQMLIKTRLTPKDVN